MDVEHELLVPGPAEEVFARFATASGLEAWWTKASRADPRVGGIYHFGFDAAHRWQSTVRVFVPARAIEWEMTQTTPMPHRLGTRVGAVLTPEGVQTPLHFYHRGWEGPTPHQRISSFCWAMNLRLLARNVAHGEVVPYERRNERC